jgi:hypothetical protein
LKPRTEKKKKEKELHSDALAVEEHAEYAHVTPIQTPC